MQNEPNVESAWVLTDRDGNYLWHTRSLKKARDRRVKLSKQDAQLWPIEIRPVRLSIQVFEEGPEPLIWTDRLTNKMLNRMYPKRWWLRRTAYRGQDSESGRFP